MPSRRPLLWILPAVGLLVATLTRFGPLPPLLVFLDPWDGIWSVARQAVEHRSGEFALPGLAGPAQVQVDRRGVPHIHAATDADAWRALGWIHARDRLFQMELQTRATAGTLTEWVGGAARPLDEEMRGLGLTRVADSLWAALPDTAAARLALTAYAEGINGWEVGSDARDLPFEYHLLGVTPQRWKPEHSYYLFQRMAYTLSWQDTDLARERLAALVGDTVAAALLPAVAPIQEPIVPVTASTHAIPRPLPYPLPRPRHPIRGGRIADRASFDDLEAGSNNWVVAPARSATGRPLLAGDPHLDLSLPSIWYEAELRSDQGLAIYGVTIPGEPAVLIGLTPGVAWSFTNSEGDFVDRYAEEVDDEAHPRRHLVDGRWWPVQSRVEAFRDRQGDTIAVDTFYWDRRGPLTWNGAEWRSSRWTALEVSDPLGAFLRLQRAGSVADFVAAVGTLEAPGQNGVAADTAGHIAERTGARMPRRPGNDGGRIFDGRQSSEDWRGDLPPMPTVIDPARGYLFSANQQGVDPATDRAYRGNGWAPPWRAMRIAELLRADRSVTVETMRRWQTDPYSIRAEWWLPTLISAAAADSTLAAPRALLAGWRDGFRPESRAAALFEATMDQVDRAVWDELDGPDGRRVAWPSAAVLAVLRDAPNDPWWDRRDTPVKESRDAILRGALASAWRSLLDDGRLGPDTALWRWDSYRTARVGHVAFFPGLGAEKLSVTGGNGTLSPLAGSGTHGASWRMVVEMGSRPLVLSTYPGGQSGNPASARYADRIEEWQRGGLDTAIVFDDSAAAVGGESITLVPGEAKLRGAGFPWGRAGLIILALLWGVLARGLHRSAWWGAVVGAAWWGALLLAGWKGGASLRLLARLGALFGGIPGMLLILFALLIAALLGGVLARATAALIPWEGAAEGGTTEG